MQEVASHSLTSSPLENKKGVQHEKENFCFGKIRHTRRFIGGFATNNVLPVLKLRLEAMEAFVQSACK